MAEAGAADLRPFEGTWIGGFDADGDWAFVRARVHNGALRVRAMRGSVQEWMVEAEAGDLDVRPPQVAFAVDRTAGRLLFDGRLSGGSVTGTVAQCGHSWPFRLQRIADVD